MRKLLAKINKKTPTPKAEGVVEKVFVKEAPSKKVYANFGPKVTHALMKAEKKRAKV